MNLQQPRTFNREQLQLGRRTARCREATRAAIGGEHAVTRHDDRDRIPSERLTNGSRRIGFAEACRDLTV